MTSSIGTYVALAFIGAQTQIRRPRNDRAREPMIRYSIIMFIVATSWYALATTGCGFTFANASSASPTDYTSRNNLGALHYAFHALNTVLIWLADGFLVRSFSRL
jgi:hypothetical protein